MKKVNESGRSMVEMLGVLAIIGVLSIGGIAGYTIAMNRYRANEILDSAAKLSILGMTKGITTNSSSINATLNDLDIELVGGCVTNMVSDRNGTVTIGTSDCTSGVNNAVYSIIGEDNTSGSAGTALNGVKLYLGIENKSK